MLWYSEHSLEKYLELRGILQSPNTLISLLPQIVHVQILEFHIPIKMGTIRFGAILQVFCQPKPYKC